MTAPRTPLPALALAALLGAAACTVEATGGGGDRVDAAAQPGGDGGGKPADAAQGADAAASTADANTTSDCPRARVTTSGVDLRIRAEPNTSSDILGSLANGSVVPVLNRVQGEEVNGDSEWFEIDDGGTVGFISGAFAECTTDTAFSPPDPPARGGEVG